MQTISNPQLELAFDYVRHTRKNIFLTGKAGTGKTTFLKRIREESIKRLVVVAPTGVAAINAGGMTIHSFFQLPFGPFLPGVKDESRMRRFSRQKINLIKSLDLLIIDEISMVRADLLDGIDDVLRRYRDPAKPFGGVQLLMIGDLHQLAPVVREPEWELLRSFYPTAYFFGSQALSKTAPVIIELKHIYRQSDHHFIELLNRIRDNRIDEEVLDKLNSRFHPGFIPKEDEGYITLTSHNASAHHINTDRLAALQKPIHDFKATIEGEFPVHAFPTEEMLSVKEGAQVMFVKNDLAVVKRFYNGKIGKITKIEPETIFVKCPDDEGEIAVTRMDWHNVKYTLNPGTREVEEEIIGTFTQYPLKLAWAITIHKSQGLTFERAIIDAQAAFAHGQVYVALSRCKSFEGIKLRSKVIPTSVRTDKEVKLYSEEAEKNAPDEAHLVSSKQEYQRDLILELFRFQELLVSFGKCRRLLLEHVNAVNESTLIAFQELFRLTQEKVGNIAERFRTTLPAYFEKGGMPEENQELQQRIQKAGAYFLEILKEKIQPPVWNIHLLTDNEALRKSISEQLENLRKEIYLKMACLKACQSGFSTELYMRTKTNAELDFLKNPAMSPAGPANSFSKKIPNPDLYRHLMDWRSKKAISMELSVWEVLPTRSLEEIVQFLPTKTDTLKKIKGVGPHKLKTFGAEITGMVNQYCQSKALPSDLMPAKGKKDKPDTKKVTLGLFQSGKSVEEIAGFRGLVTSTIESHLAYFIGQGELDLFQVCDKEKIEDLIAYFQEQDITSLSAAKAHFEERFSFGEIRLVKAFVDREREGEEEE